MIILKAKKIILLISLVTILIISGFSNQAGRNNDGKNKLTTGIK